MMKKGRRFVKYVIYFKHTTENSKQCYITQFRYNALEY